MLLTAPRPVLARTALIYLGAAAMPLLGSLLVFGAAGGLSDYVYWAGIYNLTSTYTQEGVGPVPTGEWPLLVALYAPVAAFCLAVLPRSWNAVRPGLASLLFAGGLLGAATLAAWPRYDRLHLTATVPLLAVALGVAAPPLFARIRRLVTRRAAGLRSPVGGAWAVMLVVLAVALLYGGREGFRWWRAVWREAPKPLPFSTTTAPLRTWVAQEVPATAPILVYDVDPALYRVVERLPPRPWTPLFPWILRGDTAEAQWIAGIQAAPPRLALVTTEFVAGRRLPLPGLAAVETILRGQYVAGPHFKVQKYPESSMQEIVGLIRAPP